MRIKVNASSTVSNEIGADRLSCAFPATCKLHNQEILCVYRMGRTKHSRDGVLVVQKSIDGGHSWHKPTTVGNLMRSPVPQSVHAGAVCQASDGTVYAMFTAVSAQNPEEYIFSETGRKLEQHFYSVHSHDNGDTWTQPKVQSIPNTPALRYINSRPLALPDGDLLVPIEVTTSDNRQAIMTSRYSPSDKTFAPAILCAADSTGRLSFGDPSLEQLPNGKILVLAWTYINSTEETIQAHICTSQNFGQTWTEPRPTAILCQNAALLLNSSNDMYIAGNVRLPPHGIRLWYSPDSGDTWDTRTCLQLYDMDTNKISGLPPLSYSQEDYDHKSSGLWNSLPSFTFGAPDLVISTDDNILLTYYAVTHNTEEVRACTFELSLKE